MTLGEAEKAQKDQTWLLWECQFSNQFHNFGPALVKITCTEAYEGLYLSVPYMSGAEAPAKSEELRLATPNDMLKYGG